MTTYRLRWAIVCPIVFLLVMAILTGCGGPDAADVSGKLTLKGSPPNIEGLVVSFMATDGRPVTALVASDGTYKAVGVPAGEVKVGFMVASPEPPAFLKDRPKEGESEEEFEKRRNDPKEVFKRIMANERSAKAKAATSLIPVKYRDPFKSGITTTLKPGSDNTFNFDIK